MVPTGMTDIRNALRATLAQPRSQTGCPIARLIDRTVAASGPIREQVVFPAPEAMLSPRPLGHVCGCALLRLADGTVWMVRLPGRAWTRGRLLSAAGVIAEASAGPPNEAERRIHRVPGLEGVRFEAPCLATPDPLQWDLRRTAAALVTRSGAALVQGAYSADTGDAVRQVEAALQRELAVALAAFVSGLEAKVLEAASPDGPLDLAIYNYRVHMPFRRFRLQFATTFPSLFRATVQGAPGTLGAELRAIVDEGRPVVKGLAARWGVRPGVIRQLVGRPPELIGIGWVARPREFALLLNALRPEDIPADTTEAWDQFNQTVVIGQRLFHKPPWQSEDGLEWLRACVHQTQRGSAAGRLRWLPDPATLREIERFRDALTASLRRDAGGATQARAQSLSLACEDVIDQFLSRSARRGLGKITADYQGALADLRRRLREARPSRVASGEEMWPLIPADFVSSDGARLVRPLGTLGELTAHGAALANCLGWGYATRYLYKSSQGTTFIVGLFDAATGVPCSTAEIALRRYPATHTYDLAVVQHSAENNAKPSPGCIQAVAELLRHCRSAEVRRHLEQGWWILATRSGQRGRRTREVEGQATARMALRQCLGEETYDALLAEVLRRSSATSCTESPLKTLTPAALAV